MNRLHGFKAASIVAIILGLVVMAQTAAPIGSSLTFINSSSSCDLPAVGRTVICGTATSVLISVNGGPFVDVKGLTGPAGPAGVGTQGPQGIPGPAGTTVSLNGKTCSATFDGMTQDGKGSGGFIIHLGTCQ